jgi:two-component system cell cycle sensor histidine kinase/response regulator CckA
MGSLTRNDNSPIPAPSLPLGQQAVTGVKTMPGKQAAVSPLHDSSLLNDDYNQLVARATNDAIRDFALTTCQLTWPQGLRELFGYETVTTSDSMTFWNDRVHVDDYPRITNSINQAIVDGKDRWTGEYRFLHANGNHVQVLERALIMRDKNGKAQRFVGVLMDITERKQLQDQLVRSQKMEAFGQLAAGAAHDFNNFLTTILGYSDLIFSELKPSSVLAQHITEVRKAAGRASNLAAQLLAFSRRGALDPQVVEVNSLITNLERSLLPLLGENISVACELHHEKDGAHVKVDPGQITQIILNLAVNARDAMPLGGKLTIGTAVTAGAETQFVIIGLQDTGSGMNEEVKAHLFEPFFTTKDRATGLGLATSYGIIRQSGGDIQIESQEGTGTTVQIWLPRVAAPPKPSYKKPGSRRLPEGAETILVLEDDISVRHISVRVLRGLGYTVIEAANGDDAQRLISEQDDQQIDLLLTDVVMPQMSGRHFATWLRKTSPLTKVVFVSGYLDESVAAAQESESGMFFLPKPFDPEQLAQTIRHALDA